MEGRVLHYIFYFEKGTSNDPEEDMGIVAEAEKLKIVRERLEREYQSNRLIHLGIVERTKQYLINGVSVTMPWGKDVETHRYSPKMVLTSESGGRLEEITKTLGLPFDGKKIKRYVKDRLINDF